MRNAFLTRITLFLYPTADILKLTWAIRITHKKTKNRTQTESLKIKIYYVTVEDNFMKGPGLPIEVRIFPE